MIVEAIEVPHQNVALLLLLEEHRELVLRPHRRQGGVEDRPNWAGHPGMDLRILTQDG